MVTSYRNMYKMLPIKYRKVNRFWCNMINTILVFKLINFIKGFILCTPFLGFLLISVLLSGYLILVVYFVFFCYFLLFLGCIGIFWDYCYILLPYNSITALLFLFHVVLGSIKPPFFKLVSSITTRPGIIKA